ncbi:MAG: 3-deoxy-7-phosphoheptulonate synthase [Pyrinomonadaceae bacterium MAG19_C2-C3]|nr:3-deoxy-7-phosphoheptulonate synthase [Pyrinomonadaceae bacterium MAG19_C2-C3]
MLIVMKHDASAEDVAGVVHVIEEMGYTAHAVASSNRTAIGITGNQTAIDSSRFAYLSGVAETIRVTKPYKLTTLDFHPEKTIVRVGEETNAPTIGGEELAIIAGPCAVESHAQAFAIAAVVKRSGARFFRAGAYKPRTSPYAFQGMGEEGLRILAEVREAFDLKIVTEAMNEVQVDLVERYGDMIQIGARNMQNFPLLRRAGRSHLPVLLKRGMAATFDELLSSAEYILAEGNQNLVLCERGIRTFTQHTRNTLDLAVVPALRRISHLPIIVDPSHGTGKSYMVAALARAGVAVGADGLMIEVHDHPDHALSDGSQSLTVPDYERAITEVRLIHEALMPVAVA